MQNYDLLGEFCLVGDAARIRQKESAARADVSYCQSTLLKTGLPFLFNSPAPHRLKCKKPAVLVGKNATGGYLLKQTPETEAIDL